MTHLMQPLEVMASWAIGNGELTYTRHGQDPEEECFVRLPFEFPAYMRILRLLKRKPTEARGPKDATGHVSVGTTMELNFHTFGVKLYVRHGRDGTLKVFGEDSEGRELLAEWSK